MEGLRQGAGNTLPGKRTLLKSPFTHFHIYRSIKAVRKINYKANNIYTDQGLGGCLNCSVTKSETCLYLTCHEAERDSFWMGACSHHHHLSSVVTPL